MYYQECNVQAYSATGGGSSNQGVSLSNVHAWYDSSSSTSQVAMTITYSGDNAATVSGILVGNLGSGGQLFSVTSASTVSPSDITYVSNLQAGSTLGGGSYMLGSGLTAIETGDTMIVYINNPAGVGASNIGQSVEVNVSIQGIGSVISSAIVQAAP
jgi:hypothetical protein